MQHALLRDLLVVPECKDSQEWKKYMHTVVSVYGVRHTWATRLGKPSGIDLTDAFSCFRLMNLTDRRTEEQLVVIDG